MDEGPTSRLPDVLGSATRINDRGQILMHRSPLPKDQPPPVGKVDAPEKRQSFLWEAGKTTDLKMEQPSDLNNRGQVVGTKDVGGEEHLVLREEAGQLTDLTLRGVQGFPILESDLLSQ